MVAEYVNVDKIPTSNTSHSSLLTTKSIIIGSGPVEYTQVPSSSVASSL